MNKNILLVSIAALLAVGAGAYALSTASDAPAESGTATDTTQQATVTSGENPQPGSTVHDLAVEPAAAAARVDLADRLGIGKGSIVIMRIEEKTWSDGCFGLARADEFCSQALVDGFRVEMLAKGTTYYYRTDATGASVREEPR